MKKRTIMLATRLIPTTCRALLLMVLAAGTAVASCDNAGAPCAGASGAATQNPNITVNAGAGNPIHVVSGNKYQREDDLPALPGVLGIEIVRHYNSSLSSSQDLPRPMGRGWRLSYETELGVSGNTIQITQADGSILAFGRDLLDSTVARTSDPARGLIRVVKAHRGEQYIWIWSDGRRLSFDQRGKLVQIQAASGEILSLQHDIRGLLARVTDPQGRTLRFNWLDRERARAGDRFRGVQSIDTPVGRFNYGYGSPRPKVGPDDRRVRLGNLITVQYPDAPGQTSGRRYHYEDGKHPSLLTGISNEGGPADKPTSVRFATYAYRADGKGILSSHAGDANKVTLSYDKPGQTTVTNSLGQRTVYLHAEVGGSYRILEVRGAGCATCGEADVRYRYDKAGRLLESTKLDNDGTARRSIRFELDSQGRPVRLSRVVSPGTKREALQTVLRQEFGAYDAITLTARPSVMAGRDALTRIVYNSAAQPLIVSEAGWAPAANVTGEPTPVQRTTHFSYKSVNARSVMAAIDGPLPNGITNSPADSDVTTIAWDSTGSKIVSVTLPGNQTSTLTYDDAGRLNSVRNAAGKATLYTYNARGRQLTSTTNGITQTTLWDAFDNAVETGIATNGNYQALTRLGFDAVARPVWIASSLGIVQHQRFDTEGRVVETSKRSARFAQREQYSYDERGRLSAVSDFNGAVRHIVWNGQNLPQQTMDALGRTTRYRYDDAGHLIGVEADDGAVGAIKLAMTRDQGGSIEAPNGAKSEFIKDDFGRVLAVISPDSGRSTRRYDAADRVMSSSDAKGNTASYAYDLRGRIVRQIVNDVAGTTAGSKQLVTRWTYHGNQLVTLQDPNQTEQYEHDASDRLAARIVSIPLADGTISRTVTRYEYDQWGQLSSYTLPDGSRMHYRRNGQNQVVALERRRLGSGWLSWLSPVQRIAGEIERDIVGLRHFVSGNGVVTQYHRSAQGNLARIVHSRARAGGPLARVAAVGTAVLGIGAANTMSSTDVQVTGSAVGMPVGVPALTDHRYLWDVQGNLLARLGLQSHGNYVYDGADRLVAAVQSPREVTGAKSESRHMRYAYDAAGNRILTQENSGDQQDIKSRTVALAYEAKSNRWVGDDGGTAVRYDEDGLPLKVGQREYHWNALGRLIRVSNAGVTLVEYRYNQRGERISKKVGLRHTYYLYENGQVSAELNAEGAIERQYIYLADLPVAVIDQDRVRPDTKRSGISRLGADLTVVIGSWFGWTDALTYLHNNHLGAPEVATDSAGEPVWGGEYSPFGQLHQRKITRDQKPFSHNLRLPGQYEDGETGLYYNHHRYYDPEVGRYLSPDPLGLRAGVNTYAYVDGNPLKYVDPQGLILFAFDGTDNSQSPRNGDEISNVVKFMQAYDTIKNGQTFYITGIGTTDQNMPVKGNRANGGGFDERLALGFKFLDDFIKTDAKTNTLDIDIIGFSRGAAEARAWITQLVKKMDKQVYTAGGKFRCINIRFEGLWDTVPHLGFFNGNESKYDFSTPTIVKHAVHAVALNEYRGGAGDFDLRSIRDSFGQTSSGNRIEKGFIGAHSDIGGGYGTGDLSDVALMWIITQAKSQGIGFDDAAISKNGWNLVANPILHDSSGNRTQSGMITQHREVVFGSENQTLRILQPDVTFDGKSFAGTKSFIKYFNDPYLCNSTDLNVGLVDMFAYQKWLVEYDMVITTSPPRALIAPCR